MGYKKILNIGAVFSFQIPGQVNFFGVEDGKPYVLFPPDFFCQPMPAIGAFECLVTLSFPPPVIQTVDW
ncbi:MAG: hypothetical protein COB54_07130 [Alphaproteobacteria bacterium]|nr:MAG: hypothetical protein COB54_07130 [Alphaproteobacteria bacterium]